MLDILARPLGVVLSLFFGFTHSYGFSIILLTITVRLILFPLTAKQMRSMNAMAAIQPEVKKLQAEYGSDKPKLQEETMKLYKEKGINPAAGCLPLLLQFPVFIGLFRVIRGLSASAPLKFLTVRVAHPSFLNENTEMYRSIVKSGGRLLSFGFDLAETASGTKAPAYIALVLAYGVSGWVQQALATKRNPAAAAAGPGAQMQQIMKVFPIFMALFAWNMPAGLVLYWFASNLWTIGQQEVLARTIPRHIPAEEDVVAQVTSGAKKLGRPDGLPASAKESRGKLVTSAKGSAEIDSSGSANGVGSGSASGKKVSQRPEGMAIPVKPSKNNSAPNNSSSGTSGSGAQKSTKGGAARNIPPSAGKKRGR
jgi:YidC/Oxa1 family membrane protein insertase